jgi:Uma2 family endonuclease
MMPSIQPITENRWGPTFKPKPIFTPKSEPLTITWNKLPPHFELPDDPVDNFAQPLLAEALREALGLISPTQLVATNFGLVATVNGQTVVKAPDWFYVPDAIPLPEGQERKSYTPYKEGALPEIVMEFLSDEDGREYDHTAKWPYGKWFFYEKILEIPFYVIFNPSNGALEVYQLKSGFYQLQMPAQNGRYWIESLQLFLGVWHGLKPKTTRTAYWLRWWDTKDNLLLWDKEALEKNKMETRAALEKADAETRAALEKAETAEAKEQAALEKAQRAEAETRAALEKAEKAEITAKLQIAKQMLQANAEIDFIMQVTGLDKATIENLLK